MVPPKAHLNPQKVLLFVWWSNLVIIMISFVAVRLSFRIITVLNCTKCNVDLSSSIHQRPTRSYYYIFRHPDHLPFLTHWIPRTPLSRNTTSSATNQNLTCAWQLLRIIESTLISPWNTVVSTTVVVTVTSMCECRGWILWSCNVDWIYITFANDTSGVHLNCTNPIVENNFIQTMIFIS